jgi:TFIIF-interacting CTD phosphatase-like protein
MIKRKLKPKKKNPNKKLLILDIDETLVFVDNKYFFKPYKKLEPDFEIFTYFGIKRPFLDQFLRDISKKYDLALWTSGSKEYAEKINELIFKPLKIKVKFIFSNEDLFKGQKDLDIVIDNFPEYSKKDILVIDDNKEYFTNDLTNLITIKKFHGNQNDQELIRVFKLLVE